MARLMPEITLLRIQVRCSAIHALNLHHSDVYSMAQVHFTSIGWVACMFLWQSNIVWQPMLERVLIQQRLDKIKTPQALHLLRSMACRK